LCSNSQKHNASKNPLCASKDNEVVEYAVSRSLSPAMIAEYQTQLPDKQMLAARLRELYLQQAGV
jgi:hypothetical protein